MELEYITTLQGETNTFVFEESKAHHVVGDNDFTKFAMKTGTTICGVLCKDGVVMGADARATAGTVVYDKATQKITNITDNIMCAGAGVAADMIHVQKNLKFDLELHSKTLQRLPKVATAVRRLQDLLFQYQGHVSCALIIGGCDQGGESTLAFISPEGYTYSSPYIAMGSGGFYAKTILSEGYRPDLTVDEGKILVADAIEAGIRHDLGSGSWVDTIAIRSNAPTLQERDMRCRTPIY